MTRRDRFPDYSTLAKRDTPSWNDATRHVIDKRLGAVPPRRFFNIDEWVVLEAVCDRIIPQTGRDPKVPIANFIDEKMAANHGDGFRRASQPDMQTVWRVGLHALNDEANLRFGQSFAELPGGRQDDVLHMVQDGDVRSPGWQTIPAPDFFSSRVLHDVISVYYAHPQAWDEMGFGGPASPRGYVRMGFNRHDPWDPVERRDA